ncbi:gamma interferon inducible lysosomal thiol reductase (GILT) domain-containing protein [Ditylenchus destructor]|uniref:Gamma interferon inducible lysosomal thiol reductase (GILT) domain-containing protein n=1 Tax=Ditylenchus destructor TaxID=166010 RepID=A0AAD4R1R7_9BILA|nr:gamma interferon inducible lysosomal thiol reductase (GILT) domain-containing protein [Ditylenchus destructor]
MLNQMLFWSVIVTCATITNANLASNIVLESENETDCSRIPPLLWCTSPKVAAKCGVSQACESYANANRNQPIQLTLLYESMCPYCRNFITKGLYDIYQQYDDFLNIELVPCGNAARGYKNCAEHCQHGEDECKINKYESCAIHFIPKPFPFIRCLEMNLTDQDFESVAKKCYAEFHITPQVVDQIVHCASGDLGAKLQKQAAERTHNVWPDQHMGVPWLVFNNVSVTNVQMYLMQSLPTAICEMYVGDKSPPGCGFENRAFGVGENNVPQGDKFMNETNPLRLIMLLVLFIKITGLYIDRNESGFRKCLTTARVSIFILISTGYLVFNVCRTISKAFGASMMALNVENVFELGWLSQATLSMIFIIHWQRNGSIELIANDLILPLSNKPAESKKIKQVQRDLLLIIVVNFVTISTLVVVAWVVYFRMSSVKVILERIGLIRDIFHSLYILYAQSLWHISLCIFIIAMKSLTLELSEFNGRFKEMLNLETRTSDRLIEKKKLSESLLDAFEEHNNLADKITKVDERFRVYAFSMLVIGGVHTIFALLSMIRQRSWLHLFFFVYDVCICLCHLFGVCISAAQVYTEHRAVKNHLQRHTNLWLNYDSELYDIARMFSENASDSGVGITLYGFTLITKTLIWTCLSRIFPYVLLCLQLQMGANYESWRNSNVTTDV